jgi:hypothetical protein
MSTRNPSRDAPVDATPANDSERDLAELRIAQERARGYADFFGWPPDRDMEELGAVESLAASLEAKGELFFSELEARGRQNDPPDCQAIANVGGKLAIEVTELVDAEAIGRFRAGKGPAYAEWPEAKFHARLDALLTAKDARHPHLKGGPYPGGYVVLIFSDETMLPRTTVQALLKTWHPPQLAHISRAYLMLSYDPSQKGYPSFELFRRD